MEVVARAIPVRARVWLLDCVHQFENCVSFTGREGEPGFTMRAPCNKNHTRRHASTILELLPHAYIAFHLPAPPISHSEVHKSRITRTCTL